jgi:hypothetical protein
MSLKDHILKHYCKQDVQEINTKEELESLVKSFKPHADKGEDIRDIFKAIKINTTTKSVHCDTADDLLTYLKDMEKGVYKMKDKKNALAEFIQANY